MTRIVNHVCSQRDLLVVTFHAADGYFTTTESGYEHLHDRAYLRFFFRLTAYARRARWQKRRGKPAEIRRLPKFVKLLFGEASVGTTVVGADAGPFPS